MADLKLFLDDLGEESKQKRQDKKPIDDFILGSFIESAGHRVFIHERTIDPAEEANLTDSSPAIPNWLYKYCKIYNFAKPEEIVFLDTETTGLDRGANTYAFLTGVLYYKENKWYLKQYFIESPENEILLMKLLAEFLKRFKILVSYNGKCYDIPLLDNRFKYHKSEYSIRNLELLDLLHLSRRFWKSILQGCKLQNIEALVFNYIRDYSNDIPGEFIPNAYFDYLATNNAEEISNVFYHNEQDLYSLTRILQVCEKLTFTDMCYFDKYKINSYSVAKLLVDIGLENNALPLLKTLSVSNSVPVEVPLLLATLLKRDKDYSSALACLKIKEESSPEVCLELSKIYEHHLKDLSQAFYYARKAFLMLHEDLDFNQELISDAEKRIIRIKKKLGTASKN